MHLPTEVECVGGPFDGRTTRVSQALAFTGRVVEVGDPPRDGAEAYVLTRDGDQLLAVYRTAVH